MTGNFEGPPPPKDTRHIADAFLKENAPNIEDGMNSADLEVGIYALQNKADAMLTEIEAIEDEVAKVDQLILHHGEHLSRESVKTRNLGNKAVAEYEANDTAFIDRKRDLLEVLRGEYQIIQDEIRKYQIAEAEKKGKNMLN